MQTTHSQHKPTAGASIYEWCDTSGTKQRMLFAAFTLAFHGFLRVSKFTIPPHTQFNPRLHHSFENRPALPWRLTSHNMPCAYLETRRSTQGPLYTFSDAAHASLMPSLSPFLTTTHGLQSGGFQHPQRTREQARPLSNTSAGGGATLSRHTFVPILQDTRHPYHPVTHHSAPLSHYQTLCDQVLNQFGR